MVPVFLLILFNRTDAGTNDEFLTLVGAIASSLPGRGRVDSVILVEVPSEFDAGVLLPCKLPNKVAE